MAFHMTCEACGTVLPVAESLLGRTIKCRSCGEQVTVRATTKPPADDTDEVFDAVMVDDEPAPPKAVQRPVAAGPARAVAVSRPARRDDPDDEPVRRPAKKSNLPLLVGVGLGAFLLVGGGAVAVMYAMQGNDPVAQATGPADPPVAPRGGPRGPMPGNAREFKPPTEVTDPQPIAGKPNPEVVKADPPKKPDPVVKTDPTPPTPEPKRVDPPPAVGPTPAVAADPPRPAGRRERLDPAVLDSLKRSAVYLEVDDGQGGGSSGSGWFGIEPGLIVTNAHVIGMRLPGSKEPNKITAFLNSGVTGKQKQFEGQKVKVLAVDRDMDLAILQIVNEKDLPPPMPIKPSSDLRELDPLVALGFPGGRRLSERNRSTGAPTVTVTQTAVSAFRDDDGGNRYSIQIQGGVVHGNSGGPIVDADGNVVGVAVRVDINPLTGQMTNIAYAVPAEYVTGLMAGRAVEAEVGQPYHKGDRIAFPVTVRCADAMGKIKSVGVGTWVGETESGVRPAADTHQEHKGDVGYREVPLAYDKQRKAAVGEVDFPKEPDGRSYWVQPYFENSAVRKRYTAGTAIKMTSAPVDRVPATLTPKFEPLAEHKVRIVQTTEVSDVSEVDGKEVRDRRTLTQTLKLVEHVDKPKVPANLAQFDLALKEYGIDFKRLDADAEIPTEVMKVKDVMDKSLTKWGASATVARSGMMTGLALTTSGSGTAFGTDPARRALLVRLANQLLYPVQESLIPLPTRSVNAGDTWTATPTHRFVLHPELLLQDPPLAKGERRGHVVREDVVYTYLGKRDKSGRGQLVIAIEGVLRTISDDAAPCGYVKGLAVVNEADGNLFDLQIKREFDLDTSTPGLTRKSVGKEEYKVTREK